MYRLALVLLIACCSFAPFTAELINRGDTEYRKPDNAFDGNDDFDDIIDEIDDQHRNEDAFDKNDNNDDNGSNQMEYGNDVVEEPEGEEDEFGNKNELVNNPKAWFYARRRRHHVRVRIVHHHHYGRRLYYYRRRRYYYGK